MERTLSKRQLKLLRFINDYTLTNHYSPNYREMADVIVSRSTSIVAYNLGRLEELGLIGRGLLPNGVTPARGVYVTRKGARYLDLAGNLPK